MRTLDYMRRIGVASRAQAIQPLPPAATLSPLTITLMNYEEEREEPGSSLWQIWNVRDTQQIMDVDDEAVP